jgi:hypothetical protein
VHADGSAVDLSTCGTGPVFAQTTQASHTRDAPPGQNGYGGPSASENHTQYLFGARTLFHPLAGCKSDADAHASDPSVRACSFETRDFAAELAAGTAQIFRSELAAASWNLLQFLIVTSCDHRDDNLSNDPECFQPTDAWRTDKCSLAAPQHCRNVQIFLALAAPEEGFGKCNTAPDCSAAAASVGSLWPPNHQLVEVSVAGVTDEDGDAISIAIDSIFQDEPVNAAGDGNTAPDGAGIGSDVASVRSERSGTPKAPGDGRVYHLGFSADDGRGGACEGSVSVCVPHDQRGGGACIDGGPLFDSTRPGP